MSQPGYIYFASNPSMANIIKIGRTKSPPSKRLDDLRSTGVPTPFILEACFRVSDSSAAEKRVHNLLSAHRLASNREFFSLSVGQALRESLPVLMELGANGQTLGTGSAPQSSRMEEIEEKLLIFISEVGCHSRADEYELQHKFQVSKTRLTLHIGRLLKKRFVKRVCYARQEPFYEIEHDGIQYLIDHQIVQPEAL